jgi:hypothetical protein
MESREPAAWCEYILELTSDGNVITYKTAQTVARIYNTVRRHLKTCGINVWTSMSSSGTSDRYRYPVITVDAHEWGSFPRAYKIERIMRGVHRNASLILDRLQTPPLRDMPEVKIALEIPQDRAA